MLSTDDKFKDIDIDPLYSNWYHSNEYNEFGYEFSVLKWQWCVQTHKLRKGSLF